MLKLKPEMIQGLLITPCLILKDHTCASLKQKENSSLPLDGKEQARGYADSLGCRFVILSNGVGHYQWDLEQGNPFVIDQFPTQSQLELRQEKFNPSTSEDEIVESDYIALTQHPNYAKEPDYINESKREDFIARTKIRLLRDYQLEAVHSVQNSIKNGNDRFLTRNGNWHR